jgi:molybdopterin-guanine dinucleotide biosynthesis protein A
MIGRPAVRIAGSPGRTAVDEWPAPPAGVVLAGGRSSRMGAAKAGPAWHGSTLLHRTVALLGRTLDGPVVVVGAPGQVLPELPAGVAVVEDPVEGLGPLQGLAVGLAAVADRAEVAFVCSTDLPFLHPAFVRRVLAGFTDPAIEVVLPVARGFRQPLAGGYRTSLAGTSPRSGSRHPRWSSGRRACACGSRRSGPRPRPRGSPGPATSWPC